MNNNDDFFSSKPAAKTTFNSTPVQNPPNQSNKVLQNNLSFNGNQYNDQSRAFIQSSVPNPYNPFSNNSQMNDQNLAFVQSGYFPNSNASASTQVNSSVPSNNNKPPQQSQRIPNSHVSPSLVLGSAYKESSMEISQRTAVEHLKYNDDEEILESAKPTPNNENTPDIDLDKITNLSIRLKRKIIQSSSFHEQTFPMLVSLAVDELKSTKKVPIDLVCVIDNSGSMTGEKIKLVKNSFQYLLEYLNEMDRLSIVIFDDKASRIVPLIRTTPLNKKKIMAALRSVNGNGGTDINLGMLHAFQVLKQRRYINPVTSIFLLSDGIDEGAQKRVKSNISHFHIGEDITVNTFGFGKDHDPQLMTGIADLRDGNFYFIEQLDTVDEAFVDCLGGLISSVAQNVEIRIKPEQSGALQGVEIMKAYGDDTMWTYDNGMYITKMATLICGKQKDYVLELKIPTNQKELQDHEKSVRIASAEALITGLNDEKVVKKAELEVTLLNEIEEVKDEEEEDDREVMKNFYRVKGALVMDEARKLADNKRNEEAKKVLQRFKEEVENSFLKGEEFIKNMIKDIEKAIQDVNPVVYQESGRMHMVNNQRAQMQQKSNLAMANCYQNYAQTTATTNVRAMKSKK